MMQSLLLVVVTACATWFLARWLRSKPPLAKLLNAEQTEIGRAIAVGDQLDGARDRATLAEVERNKLALAKAVKAALWVTDARLNPAVPELLAIAQRWPSDAKRPGKSWKAPEGVTDIEGEDDPKSPWASWSSNGHHWRLEAERRPSILPEEIEEDIETCKVFLDRQLVLDMSISSKDQQVMWIDALTVGPWVSDLLAFAGAQKSAAQRRTSARSARQNQERADRIHWS
jgi:hypothetical protein